jgi:hypothetical protein
MLDYNSLIFTVSAISKKRFAEEKKLSVGLEKYTRLQRDYTHNKEGVGCYKTVSYYLKSI